MREIKNNIFYKLGNKLYINITNRCCCDCIFCIRRNGDSVGNADTLWLEHEPTVDEIKSAFDNVNLSGIIEIDFCGYGEPMERADVVVEIGGYIKSITDIPVRLNTNGLVKLINPEFDISNLSVFDSVSVSLNADNAADYQRLTRSIFGEVSFDSMLDFANQIKARTKVFFTIVDVDSVNIEKCKTVCDNLGIELRVRRYEGD